MKYVLNSILIVIGIITTLCNNAISQIAIGLTIGLVSVALVILEIVTDIRQKKSDTQYKNDISLIQRLTDLRVKWHGMLVTINDPETKHLPKHVEELVNEFNLIEITRLIELNKLTNTEKNFLDKFTNFNQIKNEFIRAI